MIVVATTRDDAATVVARLDALGLDRVAAVQPGAQRTLVTARAPDPWAAERAVAVLRAEGWIAVDRPDSEPQLSRWWEETRPIVVGDRVSICPAWSEHRRTSSPGLLELGLGGFGSGHHPTTRLVLDALASRLVGGERVLDVGCGSGVLGLAALRFGAASVTAIDLKPEAVAATRRNAVLNRLDGRVEATTAPLDTVARPFDVVVANIARDGLVQLAADLVTAVAPGGWLAASGISPGQCDQVAAFLRPLEPVGRCDDGEWSVLVLAAH